MAADFQHRHMILAEQVLKFGYTEDFMEMFRVVIQLGAILGCCGAVFPQAVAVLQG